MSRLIAALLLLATVGLAYAQAPSRGFDFELRQSLDHQLDVAVRRLDVVRRESHSPTPGQPFATVLAQHCAASDDDYWDAAGRWMVGNATPRILPGARLVVATYGADQRRQLLNVEDQIAGRSPAQFLAVGERATGVTAGIQASLRQRAEWTTAMLQKIAQLRATHDSDPSSLKYAMAFATWTRSMCNARAGHAAAARAMLEKGYPYPATSEDKTELAFVVLIAASADGTLAAEALTAGGGAMSASARRILEPLAARAPATPEPTP